MSVQAEVRPIEVVTEQATQVLIREARRRQRRRRLIIVAGLFILCVAVWFTVKSMGADGSRPASRPLSPKGRVYPTMVASRFYGTWHVHTTSVTIQSDGRGSVVWPGPLKPGESEATAPPGTAELRLTSANGDQATAMISGSSEVSVLPDGPAQLHVSRQDLLYLAPDGPSPYSPFGRSGLCGPGAAALTLSQQIAEGINCGA
jgi:hypothetical protein